MSEEVLTEVDNGVLIVTINRPEAKNAMTKAASEAIAAAMDRLDAEDDLRVGILTGAGGTFCSGMDLKGFLRGESPSVEGRGFGGVVQAPPAKPLIAAVNGAAVGVGLSQILSFDVILIARSAKVAVPFVKVGVVPELASSHFLVQRMGFGAASEFALTGRFMEGDEAAASGLANRVVDDAGLMDAAREVANAIAVNPDPHLAWTKELLTQNGSETDLRLVQDREQALLKQAYESAEHKEAVDAFREKRKPNLTGN